MTESEARDLADRLQEDLKRATADFHQMQHALDEVVRDAPSGIPFSDGQVRIVQRANALRIAFEKYREALTHYSDFITRGAVPQNRDDSEII
ncbi:MAG TPA: hypothetical protein VGF16_09260 [Bryobacteraceae bacterium]